MGTGLRACPRFLGPRLHDRSAEGIGRLGAQAKRNLPYLGGLRCRQSGFGPGHGKSRDAARGDSAALVGASQPQLRAAGFVLLRNRKVSEEFHRETRRTRRNMIDHFAPWRKPRWTMQHSVRVLIATLLLLIGVRSGFA